jgi:uncharacterized protein YccT (UPF0319 family)
LYINTETTSAIQKPPAKRTKSATQTEKKQVIHEKAKALVSKSKILRIPVIWYGVNYAKNYDDYKSVFFKANIIREATTEDKIRVWKDTGHTKSVLAKWKKVDNWLVECLGDQAIIESDAIIDYQCEADAHFYIGVIHD